MTLSVGVIGGGRFGEMHLKTLAQAARGGTIRLAGVADKIPEVADRRAAEFGIPGYTDHREMLESVDAVTVATPDHLHRAVTLDAIRAGCHVLIEKPMDVTLEGCEEIRAEAEQAGVHVEVDFHKRHDPTHRETRKRIHQGELGEILYGHAYVEDRIEVPVDWFSAWADRSSPGWFIGIHMYDLISWMMDDEPVRVTATGSKKKLAGMGIDTFDALQAKFDFRKGASVTIDASWMLPRDFEAPVNQGIRLVGTEGLVELDTQDRGARSCGADRGMETWNLGFFHERENARGESVLAGYGVESIEAFLDRIEAVRSGAVPTGHCDIREGTRATAMAVAAHESATAGGASVPIR